MQLATRDDQINPVAPSRENHEPQNKHDEQTNGRGVLEDHSSQTGDHLQILARATNDAVRDWDVRNGRLAWPQGLDTLLGYCRSSAAEEIAFWNQRVHPEDLARDVPSIADAFSGKAEHWSDEYRFRRADGNYIVLLERALIVRDPA